MNTQLPGYLKVWRIRQLVAKPFPVYFTPHLTLKPQCFLLISCVLLINIPRDESPLEKRKNTPYTGNDLSPLSYDKKSSICYFFTTTTVISCYEISTVKVTVLSERHGRIWRDFAFIEQQHVRYTCLLAEENTMSFPIISRTCGSFILGTGLRFS